MKKPVAGIAALGVGLGGWVTFFGLGFLPDQVRYRLLLAPAWLVFQFLPGRKKRIKGNLRMIDPKLRDWELQAAAWENVKTLVRSWSSLLSIRQDPQLKTQNRIIGADELQKAYEARKKIIVVFPHVGPINELVSVVASLAIEAFVPAENIPPLLFKLMAGQRARTGFIEFAVVKKGQTMKQCAQKLSLGKVVILAMDMPPAKGKAGYVLSVGQAETEVQVGAVKLALDQNAEVFLAYPSSDRDGKPHVTVFKFDLLRGVEDEEGHNTRELLAKYETFLGGRYYQWWRLSLVRLRPSIYSLQELGYPEQISRIKS